MVVIGGGNVAYDVGRTVLRQTSIDAARTAMRRPGVREVYLCSLESLDEMPADDIEIIEGDDWTADKGRFSWKIRIIDKPNDSYLEIVVDKETGKIIHECVEPWSKHVGHGTAKWKQSAD